MFSCMLIGENIVNIAIDKMMSKIFVSTYLSLLMDFKLLNDYAKRKETSHN